MAAIMIIIKVAAAALIISSWILLHFHIVFRYKQRKNVDLQKGGFVDNCNGGNTLPFDFMY